MKTTYILILIILLTGCRSKKIDQRKEVKKVNEILQNDIFIENDLKEKTTIFRISKDESISLESDNPSQPSQIIYKGDTLNFQNAKVVFSNSEKKEKTEQELQDHSKAIDNSSRKTDAVSKEKDRQTEITSPSWGLNIGVALGILAVIALGYFHLKTKPPGK